MKKCVSILILILIFFIIYFFQVNFFNWFNLGGVKPNCFVIFILIIGLFSGKKVGTILGIIFGIILDLLVGKTVGISGITFGIIGFLGDFLDKNFSKESKITIILMMLGCTVFYEILIYGFYVFKFNSVFEVYSFIKILFIELIFNTLITIILYPLIQNYGYKLETNFKKNHLNSKGLNFII